MGVPEEPSGLGTFGLVELSLVIGPRLATLALVGSSVAQESR